MTVRRQTVATAAETSSIPERPAGRIAWWAVVRMVGRGGVEPLTFRFSGPSNGIRRRSPTFAYLVRAGVGTSMNVRVRRRMRLELRLDPGVLTRSTDTCSAKRTGWLVRGCG